MPGLPRPPVPTSAKFPPPWGLPVVVLLAMLTSACVTSRVEESKAAATGIDDGESVVVLATSYHSGNKTESDFLECLGEVLDDNGKSLTVYPADKFRDELFPWFEPRTMPRNIKALPDLLARPGVTERIRQHGVRYLIWIKGSTERTSDGGGMSCAASPAGGGCFGLMWWEDDGAYEANIWDLKQVSRVGAVSAAVHGTSMVPAVILPLPFIARTETAACKGLARQLRAFIVEEGPS